MSQASHQGGATGVARRPLPPQRQLRRRSRLRHDARASWPSDTDSGDSGSGSQEHGYAAAAPTAQPGRRRRRRCCRAGGRPDLLLSGLLAEPCQADTAQLIRVQKIQSNLLSADATATNAFLVGGLEPPAQRAVYDQALSSTSSLIVEAAQAQPADAAALSALNQQVASYAATIEQARANNRQGLPVGAQYLRNASADLRSTALPILDNLVSSNAARAADDMDARVGYVFPVIALLALVGVIVGQIWLARRFKRRINVGMLASAGRAARHHGRRLARSATAEQHAQLDLQRQLRRGQHRRGCPDRCQQRKVQ